MIDTNTLSDRDFFFGFDHVQVSHDSGVPYEKMIEFVNAIYEVGQYEATEFAKKARLEIAAQSLRLFEPICPSVRSRVYHLFGDGKWRSTAQLLASFALDFISHTSGDENAYWTLMTEHVGGPYPQVSL